MDLPTHDPIRLRSPFGIPKDLSAVKRLTEAMSCAIWFKDHEQRYLFANAVLEQMVGRAEDKILGLTDDQLMPAEVAAQLRAEGERTLREGEVASFEIDLRGMSAGRIYLGNQCPVRDSGGKIVGLIGIAYDVTQRKSNEEAIRLSRDHLNGVLNNVAESITVQDTHGRLIYANTAAAEICGFSKPEELLKADLREYYRGMEIFDGDLRPISPEDLPGRKIMRGDLRPQEALVGSRSRKTGVLQFGNVKSRPILDEKGRLKMVVTVTTDVTEKRLQEKQRQFLLAQEMRARAEAEKRAAQFDLLAEISALFGAQMEPAELLTRIARKLTPILADFCRLDLFDWDREKIKCRIQGSKGAEGVSCECATVARQQTLFPQRSEPVLVARLEPEVGIRGHSALDAYWEDPMLRGARSLIAIPWESQGRIYGAMLLCRGPDTSPFSQEEFEFAAELGQRCGLLLENQHLNQKSRQAVQIRDEFLSIASHELKTPLTTLQIQLEMLAETGLDPRAQRLLGSACGQLDRITALIGNLLDVSRINAGRMILEWQKTDLRQVVQEVVERFQTQAKRAGCRVETEVQTVFGLWDRHRLEQVVVNLLTNAIKYGAGKPVLITLRTVETLAELVVQDQGIGIARADQERIFDRFERAVSSQHFGGLGLGLYISRQIVEAHAGSIEVESALGEGTRFRVMLPCHPKGAGLEQAKPLF